MATVAHCLFCFEVLSASLEKRQHLSLPQVEDLWARFQSRDSRDTLRQSPLHDTENPDQDPELQDGDDS